MKLICNIFVLFLILGLCTLLTSPIFCQAKYNVYMIDPANVPIIGGEIDALWQNVTMAPCTTVVKDYARTHGIDPKPSPADYKINFGMLWSDKGLYFLVRIVDDTLVFDEPGTKVWNGTQSPFPRWWRDDSFNLLFTSDMQPPTTQEIWEFAWLTMNPVEVKALFEKQWVFPEDIECNWVKEATHTYATEIFISWDAFLASPDSGWFPFELRGRDDDLAGEKKYPQTFYQWNSDSSTVHEDSTLFTGQAILLNEIVTTAVQQKSDRNPDNFTLEQNYPNPFNPTTNIQFTLAAAEKTSLKIYDVQGRMVATLVNEIKPAGTYQVSFSALSIPSGLYIYVLETGKFTNIKKMMVLK